MNYYYFYWYCPKKNKKDVGEQVDKFYKLFSKITFIILLILWYESVGRK